MACSFVVANNHALLFNVYLPCWLIDESYCANLGVVRGFMKSVLRSCRSIHHDIVIAGDFNTNPLLIEHEHALGDFKHIITERNLVSCTSFYKRLYKFTHRCLSHDFFTWIDNMYVPHDWVKNVLTFEVIVTDDVINHSDHLPLSFLAGNSLTTDNTLINGYSEPGGFYKYIW